MTTYSIKAPNGKTYDIEGPEGASEEDVRAEVLRRDPSAAGAAAAPKPAAAPAAAPQGLGKEVPLPSDNYIEADVSLAGMKKRGGEVVDEAKNIAKGVWKSVEDLPYALGQLGSSVSGEPGPIAKKIWPKAYIDKVNESKQYLTDAVKAKEKADAPLMDTPGGLLGNVGGNVAQSFLPSGPLIRGAKAADVAIKAGKGIPFVPKFLQRGAVAVSPGAITGAGQGVLTPSSEYDPVDQGVFGGLLGAGFEAGGRALGFATGPGKAFVKQTARDSVKKLQEAGLLPNVLAMHLLPETTGATQQLARTPFVRKTLLEADEGNRAALTAREAERAGVRGADAENVTTAAKAMKEDLDDMGNTFRATQGRVPVTGVSRDLQQMHDEIEAYAQATSKTAKSDKLQNASDALSPIPQPDVRVDIPQPPPQTVQQMVAARAGGSINPPTPPLPSHVMVPQPTLHQGRTVNELMDLRNAASQMLQAEKSAIRPSQPIINKIRAMRERYEDAIKQGLPKDQHAAFDDWLKQYGAKNEFLKAADKSGTGGMPAETLTPKAAFRAAAPTVGERVGGDARQQMLRLLTEVAPGVKGPGAGISTELGRAATTYGLPSVGAVGGFVTGEDMGDRLKRGAIGAAAGASGAKMMERLLATPGGAKYLTGAFRSPEMDAFIRKLMIGGATSINK